MRRMLICLFALGLVFPAQAEEPEIPQQVDRNVPSHYTIDSNSETAFERMYGDFRMRVFTIPKAYQVIPLFNASLDDAHYPGHLISCIKAIKVGEGTDDNSGTYAGYCTMKFEYTHQNRDVIICGEYMEGQFYWNEQTQTTADTYERLADYAMWKC